MKVKVIGTWNNIKISEFVVPTPMETVMRASQQRLGLQRTLSAIRAQVRAVERRLAAVQRGQREVAAALEAGDLTGH